MTSASRTPAGGTRSAHEDVAVLDTLLADDLAFHGPSGGVTTKSEDPREPALGSASVRLHHRRGAVDPGARLYRHRDRPSGHLAPVGRSVEDRGAVLHGGLRLDRPALAHARVAVHGYPI